MRDDSKFGGLAAVELCQGFRRELVELACFRICLDLAIPDLTVIVREPGPKLGKLLGSQILNFALQRLDLCHDVMIITSPKGICLATQYRGVFLNRPGRAALWCPAG